MKLTRRTIVVVMLLAAAAGGVFIFFRDSRLLLTVNYGSRIIHDLAFSPEGSRLAVAKDNFARLEDADADWRKLDAFTKSSKRATDLKVWEVKTGKELFSLNDSSPSGRSVAFSADGKSLVAPSSDDGVVIVMDAASGQVMKKLKVIDANLNVGTVAVSPDGKQAAATSPNEVRLFDLTSGQVTRTAFFKGVWCLAFSPDGKLMAVGANTNSGAGITILDVATGVVRQTLIGDGSTVTSIAWTPDGKRLAAQYYGGGLDKIKLWDLASGKPESFKLPIRADAAFALSPDGKHLAVEGGSFFKASIQVLDIESGKEVLTLRGHYFGIHRIWFSPDGKRLASAGFLDKQLKLWDVTHDSNGK